MIATKIWKMGKMRLVAVTGFKAGEWITLKPKGSSVKVIKKVAKLGERRVVFIPKGYFEFFPVGSDAFVSPMSKKEGK